MWIRTQNGKRLIKCENILLYFDINEKEYKIINMSDSNYTLGIYSTETNALFVLDDIETKIISRNVNYVYNMPLEGEL